MKNACGETRVTLYTFPYWKDAGQKTRIFIDGTEIIDPNSRLAAHILHRPMREWLNSSRQRLFRWNGLLAELADELNEASYVFEFDGTWSDFEKFRAELMAQREQLARAGRPLEVRIESITRWTIGEAAEVLTDLMTCLLGQTSGSTALRILRLRDDLAVPVDIWATGSEDLSFVQKGKRLRNNRKAGVCAVILNSSISAGEALSFLKSVPPHADTLILCVKEQFPDWEAFTECWAESGEGSFIPVYAVRESRCAGVILEFLEERKAGLGIETIEQVLRGFYDLIDGDFGIRDSWAMYGVNQIEAVFTRS